MLVRNPIFEGVAAIDLMLKEKEGVPHGFPARREEAVESIATLMPPSCMSLLSLRAAQLPRAACRARQGEQSKAQWPG